MSGSAGDATSAKSIFENTTPVGQFTADESVTWTISGTDASLFTIDSSTGSLSFSKMTLRNLWICLKANLRFSFISLRDI